MTTGRCSQGLCPVRRVMGIMLLLVVLCAPAASTEAPRAIVEDLEWTNASYDFLKLVYTAADYSVLLRARGIQIEKDTAKAKNKNEFSCSSIYHHVRLGGSVPSSAYDLPRHIFNSETKTQSLTRITDKLIALNESNRVLVLIGDSVTRNSISSLQCILGIENGFEKITIDPPLTKVKFGSVTYTIRVPRPSSDQMVTISLLYLSVWETFHSKGSGWMIEEVKNVVFPEGAANQALFVCNIGLHERSESGYQASLNFLFERAKTKLLTQGRNPDRNIFLYRETTTQHYNLTAGYYHADSIKRWMKEHTKWSQYRCVPSKSTDNAEKDWRQRAERAALAANNISHVHLIPFRSLSRHYHDMHPLHFLQLRSKLFAKAIFDCTHFQSSAAVVMYRILWHDLLSH